MLQPTYGGLDPTTSPNDFVLGAINTDVNVMITQRSKQDGIIYQKNQARGKRYFYTCTITSAILAICDIFNEEITDEELNTICEEAISQGLDPQVGWSFWEAIDCARRYWNRTRPDKRVLSFKLTAGSREYFTALTYGYSLVCGYQGNKAYNDDKELDGVVGGKEFKDPTYSHCIRKYQDSGIKVVDNYIGVVKYNIYTLENPKDLQDNGVFYPSHYIFLRETDLTQSQLDRLEGKKLKLWNGDRENDPITRYEAAMVCGRLPIKASMVAIWDGLRPDGKCTRYEGAVMIGRAIQKELSISNPDGYITRGEFVELIIRTIRTK